MSDNGLYHYKESASIRMKHMLLLLNVPYKLNGAVHTDPLTLEMLAQSREET